MKDIEIVKAEVLAHNRYLLQKYTFRFRQGDEWVVQEREVYDRGNGAVILLYNREQGTVILTRQFRLPTFVNGNEGGMLIEACAGLLDRDHPEVAIRRETQEETGYQLGEVEKVFEAYMSPGSVTEILYFFIAGYTPSMKVEDGGGLEQEEEDIEVLELPFARAWEMMERGEIRDGKTMMLLQYVRLKGIL